MGNTRVSFTRNSAGVSEILDTGNYYAFGLNHIGGNGLNSSGFGSWQSYKYNGKELQETGMYDYGARMYMSDLGRWGVIDPLAEQMTRYSPYNYAVNNPVMFIDPDGRKVRYYRAPSAETIPQPGGGMLWFLGSGGIPNRAGLLNFLGYGEKMGAFYDYGDGEGGGGGRGGGATFSQTQAYADLMQAWRSGGTGGLTNKGGTMRWWTDYTDPQTGITGVGELKMLKLSGASSSPSWDAYKNWADWGSTAIGGGFKYVEGQRTALYNSGNWIDNLGTTRSTAYAGRARGSLIGLRSDYVRTTAMYGKYVKRAGWVGYGISAGQIGYGVSQDGGNFGIRAQVATAGVVGGMTGAWIGAEAGGLAGGQLGALIGVWFEGVGAIPGAAIGGAIGGIIGGILGGVKGGDYAEDWADSILNKPDSVKK